MHKDKYLNGYGHLKKQRNPNLVESQIYEKIDIDKCYYEDAPSKIDQEDLDLRRDEE